MLKIMLLTIAVLLLFESLILLIFPKKMNKLLKKILRDKKTLKKIAILEIILGGIILSIALLI
jgi:uncharacterized protein YjeT (DUF2065 family)